MLSTVGKDVQVLRFFINKLRPQFLQKIKLPDPCGLKIVLVEPIILSVFYPADKEQSDLDTVPRVERNAEL